jgi:hypothetical protein
VFWAYLGLAAVAMLALLAVPETVPDPDRVFRRRLRIGVPARMRLVMAGVMLAETVPAAWASASGTA